jgi:hypothetical protein
MLLMQPFPFKLSKLFVSFKKQTVKANQTFSYMLTLNPKSKFCSPHLKPTVTNFKAFFSFFIPCASFSFHTTVNQKDERVMPGNLLTADCHRSLAELT